MATPTKTPKPLPEREIVKVDKKARADAAPKEQPAAAKPVEKTPQKSAAGLRVAAGILWLLGVGGTVMSIIMLMENNVTLLIVGLCFMALMSIVGSLLWKRANRIRPCPVKPDGTTKAKFLTFLWNQMGVVATFIIFLPIGIFLILKSDKLSAKAKRLVMILAAVLLVGSTAVAVDYNAPVAEIPESEKVEAADVTVPENTVLTGALTDDAYWTQYGKSYHFDVNCHTIMRSLKIYSGTLADAIEAKKLDPCDFCAGGGNAK